MSDLTKLELFAEASADAREFYRDVCRRAGETADDRGMVKVDVVNRYLKFFVVALIEASGEDIL